MIPLAICCGLVALVFWLANRYYVQIRIYLKRADPMLELTDDQARTIIKACDLILEHHECEPQSEEYRMAMEMKLYLERQLR